MVLKGSKTSNPIFRLRSPKVCIWELGGMSSHGSRQLSEGRRSCFAASHWIRHFWSAPAGNSAADRCPPVHQDIGLVGGLAAGRTGVLVIVPDDKLAPVGAVVCTLKWKIEEIEQHNRIHDQKRRHILSYSFPCRQWK